MPSLATYDPQYRLISIEILGRLDNSMVAKIASETARLAIENNCYLVLNDAREATFSLSTTEIYNLPGLIMGIFEDTGISVYKFKRALVFASGIDDVTFFETVSKNRGHNVTLFRNIDEARKWLLEK